VTRSRLVVAARLCALGQGLAQYDSAYFMVAMSDADAHVNPTPERFWQPDLVYSAALFSTALLAIGYLILDGGILSGTYGWRSAAFFFAYGLFTITVGFPHPQFGHVSFDRVAQVASLLVLGPIDAAWINGLASLIYPWHRLWQGTPFRTVLTASLNNAGLMSLIILLCGSLYLYVGGDTPPLELNLRTAGYLLLLMLSMQFLNDLGMLVIVYLRRENPAKLLNVFTTGLELTSVLIAVLIAVAYVAPSTSYLVLLLIVSSLGMLALKQYALMRHKLEALVDERTEELRLKSIELERQATHDKLTGLFNRRYADDYLQREIDTARRCGSDFSIALADIDHFKQINDQYSHAVGDAVLRQVAVLLRDRCRKTDMVARYGGEEFLLCFPNTDVDFAEQICQQIRAAVEHADWSELNRQTGEEIAITVSFGIAQVGGDSRRTTILNDADTCLYAAKNEGRNRIVS